MRLRLVIVRHGLPAARILWTVPLEPASRSVSASEITSIAAPNAAFGHGSCTIAQLLEDVNEVVPLETTADTLGESDEIGGQWGLEDYVVEVNGFECLHFMDVGGLLRDGDEVVIRALGLPDLRARKLSGRVQISTDGRRLIDGVPFGRPYLKRSFSVRPHIRIPSRKRRRTSYAGLPSSLQGDYNNEGLGAGVDQAGNELALYDDESILSSEQGTVIRRPPPDLFSDVNESDNDIESSYNDNEDLTQELQALKDEANDTVITDLADLESPRLTRSSGRVSRMTYREPIPTSSPARLSIVSATNFNANDSAVVEPSPKSTKSVRFQSPSSRQNLDTTDLSSDSESEDDSSVSEEESDSASSCSEKSDVGAAVECSRDDALDEDSNTDSSDDSSVSSDSESESEDEVSPSPKKQRSPDIYTAPGKGSTKTKNSNRRKKLRMRLNKLKELGHLAPEANFDELREWEIQHGKRPLVELTDLETPRSSQVRSEQSLFEQKREQLLRDLASGGIDVDAHSEKENIPPRYKNGKQTENIAADVEMPTVDSVDKHTQEDVTKADESSPQSNKRRKLDMSSTKRLVFGSLGVRTPKTKEDEEKTRNKLAGQRKEPVVKQSLEASTEHEAEDDFEGSWQSKVIVEATECLYDDVQLQPPSFPFQQRWDYEAVSLMRQRKGGAKNNKRNKKKNRKSQGYEEEEEYYDTTGYLGDDTEDYANGDIALNYDEEEYHNEELANGENEPDLPDLPEDLHSVPVLSKDNVVAGAIIAFKQLDMSKATNWQPQISEHRVAKVDKLLEDGTISIQLAKRDREYREVAVDENGVREYSGLEMPGDDEDDGEAEDDGIRNLPFEDLLEPKLLSAPVDGNQEPSLHNLGGSNASADEPFPSVEAELPTVSSQTRHEISQIIRDAGFRDTVDSDVAMVINAAAAGESEQSPGNNESSRFANPFSWSTPDVEDEVGNEKFEKENTNEEENRETDGDENHSSFSKDDQASIDQAMNMESHDNDDGLNINDDLPIINEDVVDGKNSPLQKSFKWSPTSYQHPVKTPVGTATDTQMTVYPQPPHISSQPGAVADAESHDSLSGSEQNDDEPEPENLDLEDSQFQNSAAGVSQNKSFLSEFSDAGSMIPNPFYEQDRSRTLAEEEEEPGTQATQETNEDSSNLLPNNTPRKGNTLSETALQQDDPAPGLDDQALDDIDLDNVELPSLDELWASTAPARSERSAAPALPTVKKTRRTLSSPRQRSSSPAFETQDEQIRGPRRRQPRPPVPSLQRNSTRNNGNRDISSPPAFETMEAELSVPEDVSLIDLTASSPRVSPEGSSDEDYARTLGLPRGPGWVKKNIPSTQRRTRSSTGGGGVGMSSSPVARTRRGDR